MLKKLLSILSFAVMTILSYKTVRTFAFVTSIFAILAIISILSILLVGNYAEAVKRIAFDDHRAKEFIKKINLLTVSLYVIFLFAISYGIVFYPIVLSIGVMTLCIGMFWLVIL